MLNILKGMIEARLGIKNEVVGTVSADLLARHQQFQEKVEELENIYEEKAQALQDKLNAELDALQKEAEAETAKFESEFDALWQAVYVELNIDPEGRYSLDVEDGQVTQKIIPADVKEKMDRIDELIQQGADPMTIAQMLKNESDKDLH